jgi:Family of unknown function (DUF5317)
MKLVLPTLMLAALVGRLYGGSFSNLGKLRIAWTPLALIGLALQFFGGGGQWPLTLLMVSFVLLLVFGSVNLKVPGFHLVVIGVVLNFLVIAVNHGMPVGEHAIVASGQQETLTALVSDAGVKHHLAGPNDELMFLGDVIAIPPPIGQIVSLGDLFTYLGVGWVVVAGMRRGRFVDTPFSAPARIPRPHPEEAAGAGG